MDFINQPNFKTSSVLKIAGFAILAIVILTLAVRLFLAPLASIVTKQTSVSPMMGVPSYEVVQDADSTKGYGAGGSLGLSARNVASSIIKPMPPYNNRGTTGQNAEEFEVTEYNTNIETRELQDTCGKVTALKGRSDVIFENAKEYDRGCNYTFKVARKSVAEILDIIKKLDPKDLSENIYTIKNLVEDFTSEVAILEKKLASIDETLSKAISAYDDITALATRVQDVESLAKIIDSKINIIERLTQERLNINTQLERIQRERAEQLDRLEYTYFHVSILENKFIDGKIIKDSWKTAIKTFVRDVNKLAQDISINLVSVMLLIMLYAVYALLAVVVIKYFWKIVKYIWHK